VFNVSSISSVAPLTINAGAGNDIANLNNLDLSDNSLANHVITFNGQAGTDTLNLNDQASAVDHVYKLAANSLTRTNAPLIVNWDQTLEDLSVNAGGGNDTFLLLKVPPPAPAVAVNGGGGTNTLNYSAYTGDVTADLPLGVATGLNGGVSGIQNVIGSIGNDLLVGDANPNVLVGGTLRNIIIGGGGADHLVGGRGDNILIAGTTDYDQNLAALDDFMIEWLRTDLTFRQRVADIRSAGNAVPKNKPASVLKGTGFRLSRSTVHSDHAADVLTGGNGSGNDWFFWDPSEDQLLNKKKGDAFTVIH
jgi:Ca2+-binding RTX toxin-like protein